MEAFYEGININLCYTDLEFVRLMLTKRFMSSDMRLCGIKSMSYTNP